MAESALHMSQAMRDEYVKSGDAMPDGSYPIRTQAQADNAWDLRANSKTHSIAAVVAHIAAMCKKHGLRMPGTSMKGMPGKGMSGKDMQMASYSEIHARVTARYASTKLEDDLPPVLETARATPLAEGVVVEVAGRTLLTAPVRPFSLDEIPAERAAAWQERTDSAPHMKWVAGRYVEAGMANRNGALWTAGDLEFGALGVRGGPLNWLHDSTKVIGTLADAELVTPGAEHAAAGRRPYIATLAALWPWVRPNEVAHFVDQAAAGKAYQSMECIAESVECGSCGSQFPYAQTVQKPATVCPHIRERSATRRFVNPSFMGAGTIVAPVNPGWAEAHVSLMPTAARLAEAASAGAPDDMSTSDFERLVASVLASI